MPKEAWGLTYLALVTAAICVVLWLVFHADDALAWARRQGRRVGLLRPALPSPTGMPIERISADLRRIRPQALQPGPGTPMVRRLAVVAAYDEALVDACHALEVPTELDRITDALERESERLRTEAELERAGVELR